MGGWTSQEELIDKSTEILNTKDQKWSQGPTLPCGMVYAACASLPFSNDFACIIVGGATIEEEYSSNVYGLNKALTEWKHLGKIREGRRFYIALPLS